MKATIPLQEIFDTLLSECKSCISDAGSRILKHRDSVSMFLHHFAILCKESKRICSEDASYAFVIYYERVRMGLLYLNTENLPKITRLSFFLEGLPHNAAVFAPPNLPVMHNAKLRMLSHPDVCTERGKFLNKVEKSTSDAELASLEVPIEYPKDIPTSVPLQVCVFFSYMRCMMNGLKEAKPDTDFCQCENKKCQRVFFSNCKYEIRSHYIMMRVPIEVLDLTMCSPLIEQEESNEDYWNVCGNVPVYADTLKRFCSRACCIQWRRQLDSLLPNHAFKFDNDVHISMSGPKRIQLALDKACQRNSEFESYAKELKRKMKRRLVVSKRTIRAEFEERMNMMNVDLGVLYMSSLISNLPRHGDVNTLPGDAPMWRSLPSNVQVAKFVGTIYAETYPNGCYIITDTVSTNRFLSSLKTRYRNFKPTVY